MARSAEVPERDETDDAWAEARRITPLRACREGLFRTDLDLGESPCPVRDAPSAGPLQRKWARPDFRFLPAVRFRRLPGRQVAVHAFELETAAGRNVQAVLETLAQTRFTDVGYLVRHPREGAGARLGEIAVCRATHRIGPIRPHDRRTPETAKIVVDPVPKATPSVQIEGFLESRSPSVNRARLQAAVRGLNA